MRRAVHITALISIASFACAAHAQDLAVISIEAPRSGCALRDGESVTLRLFNYGPNLPAGTTFNVTYSIDASSPVIEFVVLGSTLLRNSTFDYTFTTQANLSAPSAYTLDAAVALSGDINAGNNAYLDYLATNWLPSVGVTHMRRLENYRGD
jgi:hypothetical protein